MCANRDICVCVTKNNVGFTVVIYRLYGIAILKYQFARSRYGASYHITTGAIEKHTIINQYHCIL